MKKLFLSLIALVVAWGECLACTNFLAGKDATVDGSTLISYAADSYSLFGYLQLLPAAEHKKGDMRKIYDWDTGKYLGEIPEAEHTFSVVGNMNEMQVTIGETTWGGREELVDTTGLIDYGSLIYIALQRSRTAREAIKIMTDLVAEYGYYSEGESFSIGDPNEVWIMDMIGKGPGSKGAVWVATRIPDDCVSGHANQARISQIDFKDKKNWMWSKDVVDFAREKGYFNGRDKDFSFCDAYNPLDFSGAYICEARVWSVFRQIAPDMDKYFDYVMGRSQEKMPLYVKPTRKLSADDFKHFMRDQYEGTPLDITQGPDAGMWNTKLRYGSLGFKLDSVQYWFERPIATQQTGWSFVAQMRGYMPDHVGGIFWFGVDDAASNLYVPMYCTITEVPWCYDGRNGDLLTYSETSAFWVFNIVANYAYTKYSRMMPDIRKVQIEWEDYFNTMIPQIDRTAMTMSEGDARKFLTHFSCKEAEASTQAWKKLGQYLMVKYLDGQEKKEQDGKFLRNQWGEPQGPNRLKPSEDYLRSIAPAVEHE
ncbi:MAG: C69 family dipeptidase [Paludibacteraceae bacterium]|nr:C69 family dipeptidase [Paludibacteraceae bacterium]